MATDVAYDVANDVTIFFVAADMAIILAADLSIFLAADVEFLFYDMTYFYGDVGFFRGHG